MTRQTGFRLQYVVATATLTVLFGLVLLSGRLSERAEAIKTSQTDRPIYIVSELQFELERFLKSLALFRLGEVGVEDVRLRYEILYSRERTLQQGSHGARAFVTDPEAPDAAQKLHRLLERYDPVIQNLAPGQTAAAQQMQSAFGDLKAEMRELTLFVLDRRAQASLEMARGIERLQTWILVLTVLAILMVPAIIAFFAVDLRRSHELAAEREELYEQARAASAAKTRFLALVGHELRTPLTSITGAISMLRSGSLGNLSQTQEKLVTLADRNGRRLTGLIEDLLDLSRIETGKIEIARVPVDLAETAEEAVETFRATAGDRDISLDLARPDRAVTVEGDARRLFQVAGNLIGNAVKHAPARSSVRVAVEETAEHALLTVADDGPGIDTAEHEAIFSPFSQVDMGDTRESTGLGLGLHIVKSIVEAHGGQIRVDSARGDGARFIVSLPRPAAREQAA